MLTDKELAKMRTLAEQYVGKSYGRDVPRLLDEIERLRGALNAVAVAECCGCSVYWTIATNALKAGSQVVSESAAAAPSADAETKIEVA